MQYNQNCEKTKFEEQVQTHNSIFLLILLILLTSNQICLPATILKNGYDVITLPRVVQFRRNLVDWHRMTHQWRKLGQNQKRK